MHAFLILGATFKKRGEAIEQKLTQWQVGNFDRVVMASDLPSLGIDDVREFAHRLILKPYTSKIVVGIIRQAQKLTIPAQQALLKTLEEPPPHVMLIVETENEHVLLPTIVSRCQVITLPQSDEYSQSDLLACLKTITAITSNDSPGGRLQLVDSLVQTREETRVWVDMAIAATREAMLSSFELSTIASRLPTREASGLIRGLLAARSQLVSNVNPKLVLDNLFLSF